MHIACDENGYEVVDRPFNSNVNIQQGRKYRRILTPRVVIEGFLCCVQPTPANLF